MWNANRFSSVPLGRFCSGKVVLAVFSSDKAIYRVDLRVRFGYISRQVVNALRRLATGLGRHGWGGNHCNTEFRPCERLPIGWF